MSKEQGLAACLQRLADLPTEDQAERLLRLLEFHYDQLNDSLQQIANELKILNASTPTTEWRRK